MKLFLILSVLFCGLQVMASQPSVPSTEQPGSYIDECTNLYISQSTDGKVSRFSRTWIDEVLVEDLGGSLRETTISEGKTTRSKEISVSKVSVLPNGNYLESLQVQTSLILKLNGAVTYSRYWTFDRIFKVEGSFEITVSTSENGETPLPGISEAVYREIAPGRKMSHWYFTQKTKIPERQGGNGEILHNSKYCIRHRK